jgi:hypothetical protein
MSRLEGRYTGKAGSRTSAVGRQARQSETTVRAGGRRSVDTGRRQFSTSADSATTERHDWLVPMELP